MIKGIIRFLLTTFLILVLAILYLSVFGIKTNKLNNEITDSILKINNKINLSLKDVKYLLNPFNFTLDIKTKNPKISIEGTSVAIEDIQTNISLKSLIKDQFSIDYLQFETKKNKLNNIVTLARVFQNSPQLYVLDTIIKDGFINANIRLNFDEKGKIKQDYKIDGSITEAKLNVLNKLYFKNLNFNFDIEQNIYSLKQIDMRLNDIKISSPKIEIKENKSLFFVNGKFLNDERIFNAQELKTIFVNLPSNIDIKKIEFSSINDFSFNISKKLKFDNFKIKSIVDLKQLVINEKKIKLNSYLPSFIENIEFLEHEIIIDYDKKNLDIKGSGNFLLEENLDSLSYQIKVNKNNLLFNSKINIKNNSLLIEFLDYEKKEGSNSLLSFKGNFKKNNQLSFDLINLKEKNNEILIKGLDLSNDLNVIDIQNFNLNYINDKKILNNLNLKKNNADFIIKGESFDASRIVNNILDSEDESSSIFNNFNSKIDIKIKKTYINEVNYIHNLFGDIGYKDNKIEYLKLESIFPNKKKINLSIETKNNSEVITRLFTDYPKPLVKRYDFIKGFEEGSLDFYSLKKGSKSNSVLIIDNFKVKEVPVFAKLLSLASLQGIADLLTGEGVRFTDFEMSFSNQKGLTTINEMYAIGPAVSILMDGYIKSKELVSLRGTLVPATTINRSIASIPLLGKILIGDKTGEGVFGVSFKIKGPPKDLKTSVNPIKTLTPRFITRTLEKIKKN